MVFCSTESIGRFAASFMVSMRVTAIRYVSGETSKGCRRGRKITSSCCKIYLKGRVEIHYNKERANIPIYADVSGPVSWISINKDFVVVNQDGFPKNPSDVVVSGDMSIGRVANMLPLDYHPTRGQNVLEQSDLSFYHEQIYIQTDKPYYYPGETIWFKGYMNYHMPAWRDSLSRTVYVDLIERTTKAILSSKIIRIDSGFFHNDFVVPNTLIEGNIYLRAYTLLNRNFGDHNLYVKPIPIIKMDNRVIANELEVDVGTEGKIFRIQSIKKSYKPKEEIKLIFNLSDDDEPLASNFSVAITDLSQVAPLEISKTILNSYPLRILDADLLKAKLRYPVEFGINFSGKFMNIQNKPIGTLLQECNWIHLIIQ